MSPYKPCCQLLACSAQALMCHSPLSHASALPVPRPHPLLTGTSPPFACYQNSPPPPPGARRTSQLRAVYALVPRSAGGRSTAQDVEAELIAALQAAGANLRSAHDKRRAMPHGPSSGRGSRRAAAAGTGGDGAEPEQTEH